jgi:tetratricopeptide (TPR) repeat protein
MDKKRAPMWVRVFAAVLALSFILGMVVFTVDIFMTPNPASNNTQSGGLTEEEVEFDTNARMYKSMTELNSKDTTAWVNLGNTYYDWGIYLARDKNDVKEASKKFSMAETAYRKALELNGDNVNVRADLAAVLYYLGKLEESRSLLDEILSKEPTNAAALFNAALVARAQGDNEAAIVYLEKFISSNPMDPNTQTAKQLLNELKSSKSPFTTAPANK